MDGSESNFGSLNNITNLNEKNQNASNEIELKHSLSVLEPYKLNADLKSTKLAFKNFREKDKLKRCSKLIRKILKSPQFHLAVIILVILDCFFVAGELLLDLFISNKNKKNSEKANLVKLITLNSVKINNEFINSHINSLRDIMNCSGEHGANVDFKDIILNKINFTEQFLSQTEEDSDLYHLIHYVESIFKYIGEYI